MGLDCVDQLVDGSKVLSAWVRLLESIKLLAVGFAYPNKLPQVLWVIQECWENFLCAAPQADYYNCTCHNAIVRAVRSEC